MYINSIHPEYQLADIRERHARLRSDAERARAFRAVRGRHRFRSRQRRVEKRRRPNNVKLNGANRTQTGHVVPGTS